MSLGDVATKLGLPVFPCDESKRPIVATGFKAATRDVSAILAAFNRPNAKLIGVPTGSPSGIVVIDVDIKGNRNGTAWLDANQEALPPTRTHKTQSGGLHLVFRRPDGIEIKNSVDRVAMGVDVRGEGGYVIFPPSQGYSVADPVEPAEMPAWLIKACCKEQEPSRPIPQVTHTPPRAEGGTPYGLAALKSECDAIRSARFGTQEITLNGAGLKIGALVAGGEIEEGIALADLLAAGRAIASDPTDRPWDPGEVEDKIRRAFKDGQKSPRNAPKTTQPETDEHHWRSIMEEAEHAAGLDPTPNEDPAKAEPADETFEATPLNWDDMEAVPPREWVYGHFLIKRFISVLGAPGGTGKTAYAFTTALSIATGFELLGETVHEPGKVWIYNLEDPKDELLRRFRAAALHHGVERESVERNIFIDSGRDRPLVIAQATRDGGMIASPVVKLLIQEIQRRDIRVMIVDPFVRSHRLEENVNEQIDFAAALWGQVADKANCSIMLLHHFRKGGASGDAAAFRGASALIDAARAALSLAPMSEDEARRLGVDVDDRWQYIRVDNAKLNLAPPPESTLWLRLVGEDIGNSTNGRPSDRVQSVEKWEPPSAWDGMPWSMVLRILDKIDQGPSAGEFYTLSPQAKDRWAGRILMDDACKTDGQAKVILKAWKENGVLEEGEYASPKFKGAKTGCVRVNQAKVQEMKQATQAGDRGDE